MFRISLLMALALSAPLQAAMLHAVITDPAGKPVPDANLTLVGGTIGTASDLDGKASLHDVPPGVHRFRISSVGYTPTIIEFKFEPTTILQPTIQLLPATVELEGVTIRGTAPTGLDTGGVSIMDRVGAEDIGSACGAGGALDLLGSISGVDSKPCALCGSAGVGLQGLDPSYTEIQVDGLPVLSGVGALYGVEAVRTGGLASAEVQRGATRADQSGNAVAGSVNLISQELSGLDTLGLSMSLGDGMRHEVALFGESRLWNLPTRVELGWSADPQRLDRNEDDLTDAPVQGRLSGKISQQVVLGSSSWNWSLRGLDEHRFAGDVNWDDEDRGSTSIYGRDIGIQRMEATLRGSWQDRSARRWSLSQALVLHSQESWYGATSFDASQRRGLARLAVEQAGLGGFNKLEAGYTWDSYEDNLQLGSETDRLDRTPHLSISHSRAIGPAVQLEGGIRLEHYTDEGLIPLLRGSMRWQPANEWSIHLGAGQSYRPVTLFSLDKAVHAGFDGVRLGEELDPERSLSLQAGISREQIGSRSRQLGSLRLFATEFRDKAILAYVEDIGATEYSNASEAWSRGVSYSHSLSLYSGWRFDADANFSKVRYLKDGDWLEEHMISRWTGSATVRRAIGTALISAKWRINGPQALPEGRSRDESPVWSTLDLAAQKAFGRWTLGINLDNALDYTQPDDPFVQTADGSLIDSAMIYGPMVGRRIRLQASIGW